MPFLSHPALPPAPPPAPPASAAVWLTTARSFQDAHSWLTPGKGNKAGAAEGEHASESGGSQASDFERGLRKCHPSCASFPDSKFLGCVGCCLPRKLRRDAVSFSQGLAWGPLCLAQSQKKIQGATHRSGNDGDLPGIQVSRRLSRASLGTGLLRGSAASRSVHQPTPRSCSLFLALPFVVPPTPPVAHLVLLGQWAAERRDTPWCSEVKHHSWGLETPYLVLGIKHGLAVCKAHALPAALSPWHLTCLVPSQLNLGPTDRC